MGAQGLAQYISIPTPAAWESYFQAAMDAYDPSWLERLDFFAILDYYGFQGDFYQETLGKCLAQLRGDIKLHRLCWLMHYILFYADESARKGIYAWGRDGEPFRDHGSSVICVVALLAGQPIHAENMHARGYDEVQIAFHKTGVRNSWLGEHEDYGTDGIRFSLMAWGAHYISCSMVRLGRLIYQYAPYKYSDLSALLGNEIFLIDLHIPSADNGLQDDDVESSIQLAREKLSQYFPEATGKSIACCVSTWLLSPQLKAILKPESNILKFQNRFTVTKYFEGTQSFLINAFHITAPVSKVDLSALPEDTHLRREVKKLLLQGQPLQNGMGYFLCYSARRIE